MVTFEHIKANYKEICEAKLFLCVLKIMLSQHFCSILKLNYLRKMPGPYYDLLFPHSHKLGKIPCN